MDDPEAVGRDMAEALMASVEHLKLRVAGGEAAPEVQARAALLGVEALKALLPELVAELQAPAPAPKPAPFSFELPPGL